MILFGVLDRGRLISPAYSRLDTAELDKLREREHDRARCPILPECRGAD